MNRRRFLKYVSAIGAGGILAIVASEYSSLISPLDGSSRTNTTSFTETSNSGSSTSNLPSDYQEFLTWLKSAAKPYRGSRLNLLLEEESSSLALQLRDIDFFTASSINTQYDIKPYELEYQGLSLLVRTAAPTYDVFSIDHQDVATFRPHILSPTDLSEKYPDLTFSTIKASDFQPFPWSVLATYPANSPNSKVLFLPHDMTTMMQYYRKDLYAQQGLTPATTWDEYFQNAKALTNSATPYGTVCEANASISVLYEFMNHLASFGGSLWQINGSQLTSNVSNDKALAALENYIRLATYADPSSGSYDWTQSISSVGHGTSASAIDWESLSYYMDDPLRSQVLGKVGYSQNPAGPNGSFSTFGGAGLGVSKYSRNPEAGWLWLQWATAAATEKMFLLDKYHILPARVGV